MARAIIIAFINATARCAKPEMSLSSGSLMWKTLENWAETGLPPLAPRQ
jgi:hypothetical protein